MGSDATNPELLLARRAAKADARAWDEIVARYGERIYNLAYRFTGNWAEAEELTQDVFLKLFSNLHRYRGDVPLVAWALRLSRNLCVDHYRHHRARLQSETVSDDALAHLASRHDPHEDRWLAQRRELVHATLAEMSEEQATVVLLRDLQGLSYEEVAGFLDVPVGTVKSRLARARKELIGILEVRLAESSESSQPQRANGGGTPQ
ncbi:MAG: sigma-70 family RNA polymerase sigma factor [Holophagales bacterium]|nr:sigma-70 family RNA polymerase sigma factor [Holophagales bacterium]